MQQGFWVAHELEMVLEVATDEKLKRNTAFSSLLTQGFGGRGMTTPLSVFDSCLANGFQFQKPFWSAHLLSLLKGSHFALL